MGPGVTPEQAFGRVLKELRNLQGLSQDELAELTRCSRPHLSRLETGRNSPSLSLLLELAKALDVPADELVRRVLELLS